MEPPQQPAPQSRASGEILLFVPASANQATDPATQAASMLVGLAGRAVAAGEQVARAATGAVLDRTVPLLVKAVLDRVDLTELIIERVDVDRIVAQANLDEVLDRLPLVDVANYVIDEINLPQLVRESTGGIAGDAVNLLRLQSIDVDQTLNRVVDRLLRRRPAQQEEPEGDASVQAEAT